MSKVGIIGAGQLGQMLGYAGRNLGLDCTFLDPSESPPAASAGQVIADQFDGTEGLEQLTQRADVISYEFENVPVATVESLRPKVPVYPPAEALRQSQDRLNEKRLFEKLGIPVAGYAAVDNIGHLRSAIANLGLPLVLKTRRMGYDGKGQAVLRDAAGAQTTLESLGGSDLIAEAWVPFDREVSMIGVRSVSGELAYYPLTENRHAEGILRESLAPYR